MKKSPNPDGIEHAHFFVTVYTHGDDDHGCLDYEITRNPDGRVARIAEPKGAYVIDLMRTYPQLKAFIERVFEIALGERDSGYPGGFMTLQMRASLAEEVTADVAVRFYSPYQG